MHYGNRYGHQNGVTAEKICIATKNSITLVLEDTTETLKRRQSALGYEVRVANALTSSISWSLTI